jgi:hypothetical protein
MLQLLRMKSNATGVAIVNPTVCASDLLGGLRWLGMRTINAEV